MNKSMIFVTITLALLVCAYSQDTIPAAQANRTISIKDLTTYNQWRGQNKRIYLNDDEHQFRQSVFFDNLKKIEHHNSNSQNTYTIGTNQFSDMTDEEFASRILNPQFEASNQNQANNVVPQVPSFLKATAATVDWRTKGAVTSIKNQGQCGSCWTFSSTGLAESFNFLKNNKLQIFAEQQILDCVSAVNGYGSAGCNGGSPTEALSYITKFGILQSSQYPYVAHQGKCQVSKPTTGFYPKTISQLGRTSSALQAGLNISPAAVVVDATMWSSYKSGVFNGCSTKIVLNHAVLAVGYDVNGNWIVKNSWGTSWGESGYIRVAAGNTCGILSSSQIYTA